MTSVLSILICLAMLLTGSPEALEPDAVLSRTLTVYDVALTVKGEEYPITAGLKAGIAQSEGTVLLDGCVTRGEDRLFPVQARVSEEGAELLLGNTDKGYMLASSLFDADLAGLENVEPMVQAFQDYMTSAFALQEAMKDPEQMEQINAQLSDYMLDLIGTEEEPEEATFALEEDGEEVTYEGVHRYFTIENDQYMALMDYVTEEIEPVADFMKAYLNYLDASIHAGEAFGADAQAELLEMEHISELYQKLGIELSADVDYTGLEDGSKGLIHMNVTCTITEQADEAEADDADADDADDADAGVSAEDESEDAQEPEVHTVVVPVDIIIYDAQARRVNSKSNVTLEDLGLDMTVESVNDGDDLTVALYAGFEDLEYGGGVTINATRVHKAGEADTVIDNVEESVHFVDAEIVVDAAFNADQTTSPDGTVEGAFSASVVSDNGLDTGVSFKYNTQDEAVESRMEGVEFETISTMEELQGSDLVEMIANMTKDSDKLMSDGSIPRAISAFTDMISEMDAAQAPEQEGAEAPEEGAEAPEEGMEAPEDGEPAERGAEEEGMPEDIDGEEPWTYPEVEPMAGADPSALSFDVPTLNGLPEGYQLSDYYVDDYFDYISLNYVNAQDPAAAELMVTIMKATQEDYVLDESGNLVPNDQVKLSFQNTEDGSTMVTGTMHGMAVTLNSADALPQETVAAFYNGIDFDTPMELQSESGAEAEQPEEPEQAPALGMDAPDALSFTIPAMNGLPEGYELLGQYIYGDFDMAVLTFGNPADTSSALINVEVDKLSGDSFILGADGEAVPQTITVQRGQGEVYTIASTNCNDLTVTMYAYSELDDDTLAAFFAGIDPEAEQALLPDDWDESVLDPWYQADETEATEAADAEAIEPAESVEAEMADALENNTDPLSVSFETPALEGLPEGYEQTEAYYYQEYDMAVLVYSNPEAPELPEWTVQLGQQYNEYFTLQDGALVPMPEPLPITVTRSEVGTEAWQSAGGLDIVLDTSAALTDEEILSFYGGVRFDAEEAA